jgi:hypothetical protein
VIAFAPPPGEDPTPAGPVTFRGVDATILSDPGDEDDGRLRACIVAAVAVCTYFASHSVFGKMPVTRDAETVDKPLVLQCITGTIEYLVRTGRIGTGDNVFAAAAQHLRGLLRSSS